jgi:hypothetical protein
MAFRVGETGAMGKSARALCPTREDDPEPIYPVISDLTTGELTIGPAASAGWVEVGARSAENSAPSPAFAAAQPAA